MLYPENLPQKKCGKCGKTRQTGDVAAKCRNLPQKKCGRNSARYFAISTDYTAETRNYAQAADRLPHCRNYRKRVLLFLPVYTHTRARGAANAANAANEARHIWRKHTRDAIAAGAGDLLGNMEGGRHE